MLINKEFGAKIEESFINGSMNDQIFYKILFGEDVGKYIIVANNEEKVKKIAEKNKINLFKINFVPSLELLSTIIISFSKLLIRFSDKTSLYNFSIV